MHIGLIGGIGPAATDYYYRRLIDSAAQKNRDLELTIVHADTPTLLTNLAANRVANQVAIYERLTERLVVAGADCVVVTSIAGHFCIDAFASTSSLPVIDITTAVRDAIRKNNLKTVGILGTRTVMASGMYEKLQPAQVLAPEGAALTEVHEAYVALAKTGTSTCDIDAVFLRAGEDLVAQGAQAVLLGGTDLNAVFGGSNRGLPIMDCAALHVEEISRML